MKKKEKRKEATDEKKRKKAEGGRRGKKNSKRKADATGGFLGTAKRKETKRGLGRVAGRGDRESRESSRL